MSPDSSSCFADLMICSGSPVIALEWGRISSIFIDVEYASVLTGWCTG